MASGDERVVERPHVKLRPAIVVGLDDASAETRVDQEAHGREEDD